MTFANWSGHIDGQCVQTELDGYEESQQIKCDHLILLNETGRK